MFAVSSTSLPHSFASTPGICGIFRDGRPQPLLTSHIEASSVDVSNSNSCPILPSSSSRSNTKRHKHHKRSHRKSNNDDDDTTMQKKRRRHRHHHHSHSVYGSEGDNHDTRKRKRKSKSRSVPNTRSDVPTSSSNSSRPPPAPHAHPTSSFSSVGAMAKTSSERVAGERDIFDN